MISAKLELSEAHLQAGTWQSLNLAKLELGKARTRQSSNSTKLELDKARTRQSSNSPKLELSKAQTRQSLGSTKLHPTTFLYIRTLLQKLPRGEKILTDLEL